MFNLYRDDESAEDAKAARVSYMTAKNIFNDEMHQTNEGRFTVILDKVHLKKRLKQPEKMKEAESQEQRERINHPKKKTAEVKNEKNRNVYPVGLCYEIMNACKNIHDTKRQRY